MMKETQSNKLKHFNADKCKSKHLRIANIHTGNGKIHFNKYVESAEDLGVKADKQLEMSSGAVMWPRV